MSSPGLIQQLARFLSDRLDVEISPFLSANGIGRAMTAALTANSGHGQVTNNLRAKPDPLVAVMEKRLAQTFPDRRFCRDLADGLYHAYLETDYHGAEKLLFWMNTPFIANDLDLERCRRPSLAPFVGDFARQFDVSSADATMCDIHTGVVGEFVLSLVSDRAAVFETDFTHTLNVALKYIITPFQGSIVYRPPIRATDDLFLCPSLKRKIASGVFFGLARGLSEIFSSNTATLRRRLEGYFGDLHNENYIYFVVVDRSYEAVYLFPIYNRLNMSSPVIHDAIQLSRTSRLKLARGGSSRLSVNLQRTNMRHTICVQMDRLEKSFRKVFRDRHRIIKDFSGDKMQLNIELSTAHDALDRLRKDVDRQSGNEFDVYGDRLIESMRAYHVLESRYTTNDLVRQLRREFNITAPITKTVVRISALGDGVALLKDAGKVFNAFREFLTNAEKYTLGGEPISVVIEPSDAAVLVVITNIGPALTREEELSIPTLGFRGMGAQKITDRGSGQGLAGAFATLSELGIDHDYTQTPLTEESIRRRRLKGHGPLASHVIEVRLPRADRGDGG